MTLNRPEVRNAVDGAMTRLIADAVDALDADDTLAVGILTGAGGTFCSGMDLQAFADGERPDLAGRGFAGFTRRPPRTPVIAAVEGYAVAGGCELVLACDLVIASNTASFGLPEVKRGLIAGAGGLLRLPQRIPRQIAMEYALTGDLLPAVDAHRWGLVNRLVEPGESLTVALDLAQRIARNAPLAVRASKEVVADSPSWPPDQAWDRQEAMTRELMETDDAAEGARAFRERREPRWTGR